MRAEIASHRNPLARLGFDTTKINIDPSQTRRTLGGEYDPKSDEAYVNFANTSGSTLIHESIHRGLTMMEKDPEAKKLMDSIGSQEDIVRHIMKTEMGDTESGSGNIADKQIARSDSIFSGISARRAYDKLIEMAAETYKNKKPGGPR